MNAKYLQPGVTPLGSWFIRHLFWSVMKPWNRLKVIGMENVPDSACIIAPNHISGIDPPMVAASLLNRVVTYLGKSGLFEIPIVNFFIWRGGCMPVAQNSADRRALRQAVEMLKLGHILCLFPEGTRSDDGYLHPMQRGVSLIAKLSGAPVVPAGIIGSRKALPPGGSYLKPYKVTIKYGEPITYQQFCDSYKGDKEPMEAFANYLGERIGEQIVLLGGQPYPEGQSAAPMRKRG